MVANISRLLKPRMTATAPASKRTILEFTESVGMVYFGFVSQRDDEHHITMIITASER